ncbi:hypothetical protein INP83_03620 [Mucilaginibacter sp. 21P]|uniref:hypothetical protein n=1 Tax=Mucilaginibacter sp. 21P TaxID=2778902 RepID=UPI001C574210|nr:hypothetical protein [Mucilaginibacter sp. 21P]QXV66192.1 hypothetical protein INP83_03620 [Mucilaginibacter sp. 21P]
MRILIALLLMIPFADTAQPLPCNYGVIDSSQHSMAFAQLHEKYDRIVAYTTEGYWQSNVIYYALIAEKQGVYYKGTMICKRKVDKSWLAPVLKMKPANTKKAKVIIDKLNEANLWKIKTDSLNNQIHHNADGYSVASSLSDGTNYRFELIAGDKFIAIEAYEPDWFAEKLPEYTQRKQFIKIRDEFLKAYKIL